MWAHSEDRQEGFSLIEMLIVIAIITLMAVVTLPNISSYFKLSLNSATRDIASTIKEAYNAAVLTGRVHRIVYDFKESNFWVESGPKGHQLDTAESLEKEERRTRFSRKKETAPKSKFELVRSITRKKVELPRGVQFEDIVTQSREEPLTEGLAYTHFFPNGLTEQALIHLKDESKHRISLVITPMLGKTELYDRYITREEAFAQP